MDADGRDGDERDRLAQIGVFCLPVSEIENIFLLPSVAVTIAQSDGFSQAEIDERMRAISDAIFAKYAQVGLSERTAIRNCIRQVDSDLKRIDLSAAANTADLERTFSENIANIDVRERVEAYRSEIDSARDRGDIERLLALIDDKSLLSLAARHLKDLHRAPFEAWILRAIKGDTVPGLVAAIREVLPDLTD